MALEAQEVAVRLRLLDGARFNKEIDEAKGKLASVGEASKAANAKAAEGAAVPATFLGGASKAADVMSGKLDSLSKKSLQFARQTSAVSLGAGGLLFAGADEYLKYAGKAIELQTQAFASGKERAALEKIGFSFANFGVGATQAMEALYPIQSVFHNVTKDAEVYRAAIEGAAIGHTSMKETADALTSSMAAGPLGVKNSREQMALMHETIGAGKMHLETLNEISTTRIFPAASAQGIYERALLGVLAGVSQTVGESGAVGFATVFRTLISKLTYMKGGAGEAAHRLGFGPTALYEMAKNGNTGMIQMLRALGTARNRVGEVQWVRDINEMFGGSRSASTILTAFRALPKVEYATGQLDKPGIEKQWQEWFKITKEKDPNFQMNVAKAELQNSVIQFGKASWPTMLEGLKLFVKVLKSVTDTFNALPGPLKKLFVGLTVLAALVAPGAFLSAGLFAVGSKLVKLVKILGILDAAGGGGSILTMFGTSLPKMVGGIGKFALGIGIAGAALYGLAELMHKLFHTPTAHDLLHKAFGTDATSKYDVIRAENYRNEHIANIVRAKNGQFSYEQKGFLFGGVNAGGKVSLPPVKVDLHIDGKHFAHAVARPMAEEVNRVNRSHETHR